MAAAIAFHQFYQTDCIKLLVTVDFQIRDQQIDTVIFPCQRPLQFIRTLHYEALLKPYRQGSGYSSY